MGIPCAPRCGGTTWDGAGGQSDPSVEFWEHLPPSDTKRPNSTIMALVNTLQLIHYLVKIKALAPSYDKIMKKILFWPLSAPLKQKSWVRHWLGGSKDVDRPYLITKFGAHLIILTHWSTAHKFNVFLLKRKNLSQSNGPLLWDGCKAQGHGVIQVGPVCGLLGWSISWAPHQMRTW